MELPVNSNKNPFEEEKNNIFGKIYLANVRNRLRELENPNDVDCKRWIWELVQNAKDSISNQPERKDVDIKINVENDIYSFTHNGSPFTNKTLTALIYKYSEGKTNNGESTGRFGTGFLTTHSLSKTVKIKGDIIDRDGEKVKGFSLDLFREGEDQELLEGLKKTEKSYTLIESTGWTTFEYFAKTARNKEAGKLGIQNFKENIAKVMLFCPEIKSIELNENGNLFIITRGEIDENLIGGCKIMILNQRNGNENIIKKYLYLNYNEANEELTKRFNIKRKLRICCAIEIDEYNNIIIEEETPCLFCSFPLIGSESIILPFIINSPDFEPDSERQTILLDGEYTNEKTRKISDPGINKMILLKSQNMYKNLVNYICSSEIKSRHLLIRGLKSIPYITRFFDREWYEKNYIIPMREILIYFPIVWNGKRYKKLTEIYLPIINNYEEIEEQRRVYSIISILCNNQVPTFEESKNYEKTIWSKDKRLNYINLESCTKYIERQKNMNSLYNKINNAWTWLDDFLVLIKYFHPEYLEKYAIIPNMYSEFVKLTNELSSSKFVPENMIECLMSLNIDWKKNHIHKSIINYSTGTDHNIEFAVSMINNSIKDNLGGKLILMHYIPYDQDEGFIEKRYQIYELCKTVWKDKMTDKKDGTSFPIELWDKSDKVIIKKIIEDIEKKEKIGDKYTINFIKIFIEFISKNYPYYIYYPIIPNQNEKFCSINELFKDDNIPNKFKECLKDCFDIDIKTKLLNEELNDLPLNIPIKKFTIIKIF